jgi:hypothetical protein
MSTLQDTIKSLPVDNEPVENKQLADTLFKEDPSAVSKLVTEFKDSILIVVLFLIFNSEQVSELIRKHVPIAQNSTVALLAIKCGLILVLYYIIKNFQLTKK